MGEDEGVALGFDVGDAEGDAEGLALGEEEGLALGAASEVQSSRQPSGLLSDPSKTPLNSPASHCSAPSNTPLPQELPVLGCISFRETKEGWI